MQNSLACGRGKSDQCADRGRCRVRRLKMKHFTIENETNNIMIHGSAKEAEALRNSERVSSEAALAKLVDDWPAARLVEIWNSLPGATPVKKFKDRSTAVSRIWKALQALGNAVPAEPAEPEAEPVIETAQEAGAVPIAAEVISAAETPEATPEPEAAPLADEPVISESPAADVPTAVAPQSPDVAPEAAPAKTKATRAKKAPVAGTTKEAGAPREGSKTSQVIAMLKREGGTTLEEIMTEMGWLKHTVRAMLSAGGSLTKKHGLVIISEKVGDKRVYSIKA
jgi:hypothetical protein